MLHTIAGRPMLSHVIDTARSVGGASGPRAAIVVVGHGGEDVRAADRGADDLVFVAAAAQLGTGHAVLQAVPHLNDAGPTLVLYGDVPLTTAATLRQLVSAAGAGVALLTVRLGRPDRLRPHRPGCRRQRRTHRRGAGRDAGRTRDREVNTGILVAPTRRLRRWLARLSERQRAAASTT